MSVLVFALFLCISNTIISEQASKVNQDFIKISLHFCEVEPLKERDRPKRGEVEPLKGQDRPNAREVEPLKEKERPDYSPF